MIKVVGEGKRKCGFMVRCNWMKCSDNIIVYVNVVYVFSNIDEKCW